MYRVPIAFHNKLMRGEKPLTYALITTHMGYRAYAEKEMARVFDISGYLADGSVTADGSHTAGSETIGLIDKSARILDMGKLERTIQPQKDDLLAAYEGKQLQHVSLSLDNADDYFSRLIAKEPFIGRPIEIRCGFEIDSYAAHIGLFKGIISEIGLGPVLTIEADERGTMSASGKLLTDTFYLGRAGRYANPLNTGDRLPIVYGNLTDGTAGIWQLPCIDTVNFVYCFSDSAVLTVAGGNSINIYADGVLVAPANYVFNASNNYEAEGVISTVTFTSDRGNAIITARGKGKVLTGTTLMENVIDIVNDFLVVENDFTSAIYEATAKARAAQVFTAQAYAAAGVIAEDAEIWEIITEMMASFLGNAYLDGDGDLVLEIDDNTLPYQYGQAGIIPGVEAPLLEAKQRLFNIINRCPCNYAYSYAQGEFKRETDDSGQADTKSQNIYGLRKPNTPYQFYWCRDLVSVQTVQAIIVAKFKNPLYEIEIEDQTLQRVGIDVGDIIIHTVDSLYDKTETPFYNHYWRVLGVDRDFGRGTIRFRCLQTNYYLTIAYVADGTHIADGSITAGADRDTTRF